MCCKLLEHIIYHCVVEHLTAHQILTNKQYGFRPIHSCETQLLNIVEEIQLAMDHHFSVDLIFIDFKKAFDTVPHEHLMKKLHHYGIQCNLYNWIFSWLTKRTQRVVIKGHNSSYVNVSSGVPHARNSFRPTNVSPSKISCMHILRISQDYCCPERLLARYILS